MAEESVPSHCGRERQVGIGSIDAKLIEEHHFSGRKVCPKCGQKLTFKEGKEDWHGLPAGVKFDPSDQELLDHLEAKVGLNGRNPHLLIDEFIPTLQGEDGICYTHPEKLPGVTRDGNNKHFFHRPSKAYTTGTRKRRKIQSECDLQGGETRWHKTGKTRPVLVNGKQKGCKKILVLYTNFGKQRKPEKTNWVMHQYHLGTQEEEKEGELVVSKVFYQTQPRQCTSWDRLSALDNNQTPTLAQPQPSNPHALVPSAMLQQPTNDKFSFTPLCQKGFEEGISESSSRCTPNSCGEEEEEQRPSANIFKSSTMPTVAETHMLSQKAAAKTASLEDIFEIKEVGTSSIPNTQEVEWIKYNAPYWPDNNS